MDIGWTFAAYCGMLNMGLANMSTVGACSGWLAPGYNVGVVCMGGSPTRTFGETYKNADAPSRHERI